MKLFGFDNNGINMENTNTENNSTDKYVPARKITQNDVDKMRKRERAMEIGYAAGTVIMALILGKSFADKGVEPYFNTAKVITIPVIAMISSTLKIRKEIKKASSQVNGDNQDFPQEQHQVGGGMTI